MEQHRPVALARLDAGKNTWADLDLAEHQPVKEALADLEHLDVDSAGAEERCGS